MKMPVPKAVSATTVATVLAACALAVSSYSLYLSWLPVSSNRVLARNFGTDPKAVVIKSLDVNSRLDGTLKYFIDNKRELISHAEVTNFLENNGVGIAFVRTSAGNKKYQYCIWMSKYENGWEAMGWLSPSVNGDPFRRAWIKENESWLRDMDSRRLAWEAGSDSVWDISVKTTASRYR